VTERDTSKALSDLDALTRKLRRECPWDREQDERSIVPHTLEEAYELADAAQRRDDAKLIDELGDVLFQVHFLALLLEERGAGDLAQVAEHCRQKLIRRHPHVFGEVEVADAAQVLSNWDAIKALEPDREQGIFGEVPENLPALLYARKVQRRAASAGLHPPADEQRVDQESFRNIGERLFALVDEARREHVDPELALRAAAQRFREEIGEQ
jgi:MazG family protein